MTDWYDTLTAPVAAAEHGVDATDEFFGSVHDGPLTFDAIDYPAAQVYVESFERSAATDYAMNVSTTLYFEWSRDTEFAEDVVHPLAAVIEETLAAMDDVGCITDYHPARIDFFSGEPASSLVLAVSVQFRVTTLVDPGTFA
jgi:hypothetical protein